MTLDQFITKYTGKYVEYHSYSANALNQCADLANQYIVEVLGLTAIIGTNAQDFPNKKGTQFDYILNTPTGVPEKGDLMIFKSADKVGHISIFVSGSATSFKSFDQNYPTGSACKIVTHNYTNVLGWMRSKKDTKPTESQEICVDKETFERLVTKSTWYDTNKDEFEVLKSLKTEYQQFQKTIGQRLETLAGNLSTIIDWDAVVNASARFKDIDALNLKLQDDLNREIQDSKKRFVEYENKLAALNTEMDQMKSDHEVEIAKMQKRVDQEIENLQKEKQVFESTNTVISWFKKLFSKK